MRLGLSLCATLSAIWVRGSDAQSSGTLRSNFTNINGAAIIVANDYLYIDGGGVYANQGTKPDWVAMNDTLAIPLASTWKKKDVPLERHSKGDFPSFMREALWFDDKESKIYAWGGRRRQKITSESKNRQLWALETSKDGPGEWEMQRPSNPAYFDSLYRPLEGLSTVCNEVGYYLNGYGHWDSDSRMNNNSVVIPGMVTYDFRSAKWTNESAEGLGYVTYSGTATCLPDQGSKGLILFMGGVKGQQGNFDAWDSVHFSNVTFYDPATKEWYWQETSGDIPYSRRTFCSVGVPGPNGTYEIFIYGGYAGDTDYGDVSVLSIPAFHWFKGSNQGIALKNAACARVGKSQMISIGGRDKGVDWVQGKADFQDTVNILDLNTMTWKDEYDADADEYDSPKLVKDWYRGGGTVKWSNERIQNLFGTMNQTETPNPEESPDPTPSPEPKKKSPTNVGAIAGGAAGGAIFLLALIGAALFFLRRSRKRKTALPQEDTPQNEVMYQSELPGNDRLIEYYKPVPQHDLSPTPRYSELGGDQSWGPHEMEASPPTQGQPIPRKPVDSQAGG